MIDFGKASFDLTSKLVSDSQKLITPEKTTFVSGNAIRIDTILSLGTLDHTTGILNPSGTEFSTPKINIEKYRNKYGVSAIPCKVTVFDSNSAVIATFANMNGTASRRIPSNASFMIVGMTVSNSKNIIKFFDVAQTSVTTIHYEEPVSTLTNVVVPFSAILDPSKKTTNL
ncbi:hypothetical protein V1498_20550 [Peribacillus sp. SCS-26]|uniref:hypothetical protein n=1 Tax=Paraperibacillus marinus TaxID=3115295 RepID=UPI0039065559